MSSDNLSPKSLSCFSVWKIIWSALFSLSTSSFAFWSASAFASASFFIFSISSSVSPEEASILISWDLLVALSSALTLIIPLASISKVTSICGTPLGDGGIPSKWNLPIVLLSLAIGLSPCNTCISTDGWLSAAVENTCDFFVGIVVFDSISLVITFPIVSIPSDNGVTSSRRTSSTSPERTPPWIAAPTATTSSGLTPLEGFLPNNDSTSFWIIGILVEPPTRITSSISFLVRLASFRAFFTGSIDLLTNSSESCSNFALVNVVTKCLGPDEVAVT